MAEVAVLLDGIDHGCCGELRHVGEIVTLRLTLSKTSVVTSTAEPDRVVTLADGSMVIAGAAGGAIQGSDPEWDGTLVTSGELRFAIWGQAPGPRVSCVGEITESRHHEPSALSTGELVRIRWRPARYRIIGPHSAQVVGYEPGRELQSTSDCPDISSGALEFTIRIGP